MIGRPPPPPDPDRVVSVGALTHAVKRTVEGSPDLRDVWVRGEVSNYKHHSSGHRYFSLKDETAVLRSVMFAGAARQQQAMRGPLPAGLADGVEVLAHGYVGVYPKGGQYQLYVDVLLAAGAGSLNQRLEALKEKLRAEGLFDPARKRPLPLLPRRVALVTSPTGAAVRDIIRVARRRFPNIELVVVPVAVQGEPAPAEIVAGLERANDPGLGAEAIILARGGGSLEDLWAFNDERVARAVFASRLPVVAGVGHETDFTIADAVADVRAPTPSAAAELCVPDRAALERRLGILGSRLTAALRRRAAEDRRRLNQLSARLPFHRPLAPVVQGRQAVDQLAHRLEQAGRHLVAQERRQLEGAAARLEALSPLAVLARGYAVARTGAGVVVRSVQDVAPHDPLSVLVADGELRCEVQDRVHHARVVPGEGGGAA